VLLDEGMVGLDDQRAGQARLAHAPRMRAERRFDADRVPSALGRPAMEGTQVSRRHP
jgi:hypothetical protein